MKLSFAVAVLAVFVPLTAFAADPPKPSAAEQAAMEQAMKAATPGPQHEALKKMAGEWNVTIKSQMDPSQPPQESQGTSTVSSLMDGRYCQEVSTSQMMGMPFQGMGITGYDNVMRKYVSIWIDTMGTGIMRSEGTADASGKVITWSAVTSDPATGKPLKQRMVTTFADDDHHTLEMFGTPPGSRKEMKMMTIEYARKQ